MMIDVCPAPSASLGLIRAVVGAADCNSRAYSEAGFKALVAPGSPFPAALTALLTIYVAVMGYRLMFGLGGSRLSDMPMAGLKIGAIMAVALSWTTFQTLVFDVATKAPIQLAQVIGGASAGGAGASDPLGDLQAAHTQLTQYAGLFAKGAGPNPQALIGGPARAAEGLWRASEILFASTAGIFVLATVATGALSALGPIFIACFLFEQTRGLFIGWVRAMTAAAFAPMICWMTTEILLVILAPWLADLAREREAGFLNADTAQAVIAVITVFGIAQLGVLMFGGMIASGFDLRRIKYERKGTAAAAPATAPIQLTRAQDLAMRLQTEQAMIGAGGGPAASVRNSQTTEHIRYDAGPGGETARLGESGRRNPGRLRATGGRR